MVMPEKMWEVKNIAGRCSGLFRKTDSRYIALTVNIKIRFLDNGSSSQDSLSFQDWLKEMPHFTMLNL